MHPRLVELVDFLDRQRADLTDAVSGIPVERHTIVPPGGGWSVAEVMEHLVILEARVAKAFRLWIAEEKAKGLPPEDATTSVLATVDVRAVTNRSRKVASPPQGIPSGAMSVAEASRKLDEIRIDMKSAIAEGDGYALERIVRRHPAVGEINLYQWIGVTAAHMRRHADQIREIGASLGSTAG
ncbi:MAG TPA: DinB family protein [Vicinamibacterales bacterium]|jgi:hypothetical protein|nr:DinB family protein [Vicinamibacterales bacterium]